MSVTAEAVLAFLRQNGEFDALQRMLFEDEAVCREFQEMQRKIVEEVADSPMMDIPLKDRKREMTQVFSAFRAAVRNTPVADDIDDILKEGLHFLRRDMDRAVFDAFNSLLKGEAPKPKKEPEITPDAGRKFSSTPSIPKRTDVSRASNSDVNLSPWNEPIRADHSPQIESLKPQPLSVPIGAAPLPVPSQCRALSHDSHPTVELPKPESKHSLSLDATNKTAQPLIAPKPVEMPEKTKPAADNHPLTNKPAKKRKISSDSGRGDRSEPVAAPRKKLKKVIVEDSSSSEEEEEEGNSTPPSSGIEENEVSPDDAVGRRIRVYWPLDEKYYTGRVSGYRIRDKRYHIKYNDGEEEWLDLSKEEFVLLDS